MDKPGLRDALPQPKLSDTRTDPFWGNLDSSLSAAAAPSAAQTPQRDLDVGLGDVARGVGAGALDLVGGIGELARQASQFGKENAGKQGGDYLEQARANMASKLSPVLDVVAGAGDLAKSGAESLTEGMSGDAKEAIGRSLIDETSEGRLTMGDGAGDLDVWAMKMAQGVGSMVPTLLAGGVTGAAAKASIGRAVTTSMLKRGATQEVAEAVAAKTVAKLATGAAVTTGATGSVGSAGVNTRESVLGMSFDELSRSDTFRQAFTRIDQDQQTQHLSDEEKLSLAREETANVASRATMSDAKVWGAAAMGSVMGDAMLFKMLAGKAATGGVLKGTAKGAVGEGIGETLEEGVQQYTINESLNEVAAADIDPMKGVVSSALEGGLIGMGTGGALGGAGGLRGSKSQPESEGGAQADPATVEDAAPVEQSDPMQANPAAAPADPDLAPAADTMADPVVAPSGEQSPLGPSASQFDELRDVPAYLRRDDTAERFKGMAADSEVQRALAGEFGQSVQELVASQMQAGDQGKSLYERAQAGELGLDPFAGNKSAQQVAMENQRPALPLKDVIFAGDANAARGMTKEGHFDDKPAGTGPQFRGAERTRWQSGQEGDVLPPEASSTKPAGELPGAVIEGEAREVGTELPHRDVVYGADQRQPDAKPMRGSATESAVGPLQTLRITRKGKPFATEKEAAMASRKGKEMPVPLNGGGFGVAEIAEVEQVKAAATTQPSAPQLDDISVTDQNQPSDQPAASVSAETVPAPSVTSGEASQLAPAIDTGYREVIPLNQPQTEVSNEPVTPVPAISSEGQGDQPGAGEPAAAGAGPAIAGLTDRAGSGNPADHAAAPPVPDGQQQNDPTLTAPAPDAGAAVSEVAQPDPVVPAPVAAPTPWAEAIDNPDGTITLKGEVPLIKQWAKDSGVKAIQGKGGLLVAKSSAAKVREYAAPAASEPVQQIEAARAEVAPEPTDAQKEAGNYKKGHLKLQGLDIALENPKGSTRSGTDKDGKAWQSTMAHDYGYIKRTLGADGDHVDVFIGEQPDSETVYVVDQVDPNTGKFDEHKVMMGFADEQAAQAGYLANYEKGWKGLGSIKAMPVEEFKRWVNGGDTTKPVGEQPAAGVDIVTLTDDEVLAVADELGISHDDNPDDARWGLEGAKKDALSTAIARVRNPSSATPIKPAASNSNIVSAPPQQDEGGSAKRAVSFSKQAMAQGEKPAKHLTRKEAELVTKEWFKQYRGASGINVQIHATQAELEKALGLTAKDGLIRRAAFDDDNGTLHVAADTIAHPKRMREILRHEVLAHYGLANVLGDGEYTKLISRIIKSKNAPSMMAVWDWVDTHYAGEDVGVQAEEVIAHLAELEQSAWRRGWDQVVAWVTKALRTVGFVPGGITAAETRVLIEGLGKKMKRGGPDNGGPDGGHKFSQESEQPTRMSQEIGAGADKGSLRDVIKSIRGSGVTILATEKGGVINIAKIAVNESERGNGKGTSAMREIMRYADRTSQMIALSPSADFGGNKSRLETFYKGLGFIENKGKNKDFSISESMYRPANEKPSVRFSQANTAADKAMEKLNLGPKPDIIDKTKANLDKLRKVDRGVVESWVDRFIKKANTEVLDALAPIKYAEDAAGITDAADSGYVAARMATGAASTMQATMLYGLPEWKDGVIQRKAGTGEKDALLGIFSDLGADLHNWLGWMAGHRAELLMAQGRENLLDANDIAALKGQGKGKEAKFLDAKARWNRLNAATLDLAQEAGLFTKEARAEFESEWYIPFFRETEDGDVIAPFKPKGVANQNAGIKKLKGGEANTNDLLENIFTSTSKLIDASMKNMAAQKTVWNLADTGLIEVIPKPNKMDYQALANGKDRIMLKLEGEEYMLRVEDPDLYRAMTFFDRKPFGKMTMMASSAKRILTAGVTASPEFMLRNFLRDSLSSWAISKDGFKPVIDSIKGVKKTLAMDGSTIDVMFSGASFLGGYVNGNDPGAMADTVRKSLRRKGMTPEQIARYEKSIIRNAAHAKGVVADAWEKYSRYGEALENANREAVYAAAIKAGKSHAQAAFESKDLMDFSMLGAARAIQGASLVLPFFNARLQGLGKLSRELRDNPREIAKRAGMITAMSLGLLAANWDDERYEELPDWDKDANWHFFVGDQHFRIPKPFEIGVMFGTIPERMVRAMGDKDTGAQFGKAVARAIGDTFALNPTPQIVKPLVEAAFNYDTFRGGPIDSPQDLAVKAEARYNEQTSLLMRELGELSGFSPKQLEHLVIGYTGTIGGYVMATADGLIRASRPGESASWRADEIPLVKAVYRGAGPAKSTQHMEEFYRMLSEVNQLKRTVDQYRSEGLDDKANELLEEQGGILKSRRSLSRTQQQVRVVRNTIELIQRDRTMSAEEKRKRIDELLARRNDLVYQAVNKNRENWE
ncbi:LPD38 domain-containing protein [Aeromonas veronii]|uniref:LPD38 domain-containing protein n=1 Tax=Aeromonas veronii TaxID=654 RepID=UPI003D21E53D